MIFRCYVIDCRTNTPNIPYADSFYTQTRYCITYAGPEQTRISICLGITWLKSPFVKSIIKSATYKTFEETCLDYMVCLRQEIAAKIGPVAVIGEATIQQQPSPKEFEIHQEKSFKGSTDQMINENYKKQENLLNLMLNKILDFKVSITLFILAFFLGIFFSRSQSNRNLKFIMSSYDLELEALKELNVSKAPINPSRTWTSAKFKRTHYQLNQLHEDFASVRKSIWFTLKKFNELERRIYKAEIAAVLGDRLLACYDQKESPACAMIQEHWKALLKEK